MRPRSPTFRVIALTGAVWVQAALAGSGLHDPGCTHHGPGATGEGHRHGVQAAPEADGHGAHHGHGADHAPTPAHSDSDTPADDCRCQGVCVPGALTGALTLGNAAPAAPAPTLAGAEPSSSTVQAPAHRPLRLLPPATGPPLPA